MFFVNSCILINDESMMMIDAGHLEAVESMQLFQMRWNPPKDTCKLHGNILCKAECFQSGKSKISACLKLSLFGRANSGSRNSI